MTFFSHCIRLEQSRAPSRSRESVSGQEAGMPTGCNADKAGEMPAHAQTQASSVVRSPYGGAEALARSALAKPLPGAPQVAWARERHAGCAGARNISPLPRQFQVCPKRHQPQRRTGVSAGRAGCSFLHFPAAIRASGGSRCQETAPSLEIALQQPAAQKGSGKLAGAGVLPCSPQAQPTRVPENSDAGWVEKAINGSFPLLWQRQKRQLRLRKQKGRSA